jgi:hypothetical protein
MHSSILRGSYPSANSCSGVSFEEVTLGEWGAVRVWGNGVQRVSVGFLEQPVVGRRSFDQAHVDCVAGGLNFRGTLVLQPEMVAVVVAKLVCRSRSPKLWAWASASLASLASSAMWVTLMDRIGPGSHVGGWADPLGCYRLKVDEWSQRGRLLDPRDKWEPSVPYSKIHAIQNIYRWR